MSKTKSEKKRKFRLCLCYLFSWAKKKAFSRKVGFCLRCLNVWVNGTIRGHHNSFCDKGRKTTACFRNGEKSVVGRRYQPGKLLMRASVLFPNAKLKPTKPEHNLISSKTDSDIPIPFSQGNKQPSTSHTKHACCLGEKRCFFCAFFWRCFASFFSWPFSL